MKPERMSGVFLRSSGMKLASAYRPHAAAMTTPMISEVRRMLSLMSSSHTSAAPPCAFTTEPSTSSSRQTTSDRSANCVDSLSHSRSESTKTLTDRTYQSSENRQNGPRSCDSEGPIVLSGLGPAWSRVFSKARASAGRPLPNVSKPHAALKQSSARLPDRFSTRPTPPAVCIADLDGDGAVGMSDLLALLAALSWASHEEKTPPALCGPRSAPRRLAVS